MAARLALLGLVLLAGCGRRADTPSSADDEPAAKIGRPAPPVRFGEWLLGDPVAGFEPGRVYVLDFWASWCKPCLEAAPHLQQVADEFADRVTVIGLTIIDDRNPLPAVMQSLGGLRAARHGVRYATTDRATLGDYGYPPYPTAVVVGADGRVAYVGSPLLLAEVLDKVLAGTWPGRVGVADLEQLADDLGAIYARAERKPAAAVAELTAFEAAHPEAVGRAGYKVAKVSVLVAAGRFDEAKTLTEQLLPALAQRKDVQHLANLRAIWADAKANPQRTHADLAVRAAEAIVGVEGPDDPAAQGRLADSLLFAGDKEKAKAAADRGLAAAPAGTPIQKWLADIRQRCE